MKALEALHRRGCVSNSFSLQFPCDLFNFETPECVTFAQPEWKSADFSLSAWRNRTTVGSLSLSLCQSGDGSIRRSTSSRQSRHNESRGANKTENFKPFFHHAGQRIHPLFPWTRTWKKTTTQKQHTSFSHSLTLFRLALSLSEHGPVFPKQRRRGKTVRRRWYENYLFFFVLRVTLHPFPTNRTPHFHRAQKFQTRAQPGEKEMKTGVVGPRVFRERTPHHIFSGESEEWRKKVGRPRKRRPKKDTRFPLAFRQSGTSLQVSREKQQQRRFQCNSAEASASSSSGRLDENWGSGGRGLTGGPFPIGKCNFEWVQWWEKRRKLCRAWWGRWN